MRSGNRISCSLESRSYYHLFYTKNTAPIFPNCVLFPVFMMMKMPQHCFYSSSYCIVWTMLCILGKQIPQNRCIHLFDAVENYKCIESESIEQLHTSNRERLFICGKNVLCEKKVAGVSFIKTVHILWKSPCFMEYTVLAWGCLWSLCHKENIQFFTWALSRDVDLADEYWSVASLQKGHANQTESFNTVNR